MTERIKLENPGDELVLTVTSVSPEKVGEYEYWLVSDGRTETLVPQKSIAKQLDRVGVAAAIQMVGKTVRLSRSEKVNKYNKPYWNLDPAEAPKTNGKLSSQNAPVPTGPGKKPYSLGTPGFLENAEAENADWVSRHADATEKAEVAAILGFDTGKISKQLTLYQSLTEFYIRDIVPIYEGGKNPIGVTPESVTAGIATLFINVSGR